MKLYDFSLAPNPKRVRMFLAEKGVEIPLIEVNTREKEQFSDSFNRLGSGGKVPVLELDDGTCISESVAICRYIEALHPEPPLMGRDALDIALVEMWQRRVELEGYAGAANAVRNMAPMFKDRGIPGVEGGVPQIPELVERGKIQFNLFLDWLDPRLADSEFIAGQHFTIADITAYVTIDFATRGKITVPENCTHVHRWFNTVKARPSADA